MTSGSGSRWHSALQPLKVLIIGVSFSIIGVPILLGTEQPPLSIPQPGAEERKLGVLIGNWQSPFHGEQRTSSASESPDCTWEGRWILNGHLLSLTATNLPKDKREKELDVFGYSSRAKRYYMMVIMAGDDGADEIEVYWFTIKGNIWRFAPSETKIAGKTIQHRTTWEIRSPDLTLTRSESSEDGIHWVMSGQGEHRRTQGDTTPGILRALPDSRVTGRNLTQGSWKLPPSAPELERLPARTGTWPNKHQETDFDVDGRWDSRLIANGYFLGWFETNDFIYPTSENKAPPRIEKDREVDIWGYSDTAMLYFRLDVTTYLKGSLPAPVVDSQIWWRSYGRGVVSISPLETKIGERVVPIRFGFSGETPDTMTIFVDHLEGVRWIEDLRWTVHRAP